MENSFSSLVARGSWLRKINLDFILSPEPRDMSNEKGFTFIELLITLSIIAVAFLPLMNMFSTAILQTDSVDDLTTARQLAQEGMEKTINLNYTVYQLKSLGNIWDPSLAEEPYEINGKRWRILRELREGTEPLEIHIKVYRDEGHINFSQYDKAKPVVDIVTLYEVFDWETVL